MKPGDFTHVEIPADDLQRAQAFYEALFGWSFDGQDAYPGYVLFLTPSGLDTPGGAIGQRGATVPSGAPMPSRVRVYVEVASIDECLEQAVALGGAVVLGKREIVGHGWDATFRDTEGNEMSLWQSAAEPVAPPG